jgi:hypothetical protein
VCAVGYYRTRNGGFLLIGLAVVGWPTIFGFLLRELWWEPRKPVPVMQDWYFRTTFGLAYFAVIAWALVLLARSSRQS